VGVETRFAGWLGDSMRGRGLSQAELARHVGVADTQISRWRRGQVVPNVHSLQRLADTFGVPRATLDRLVGYPVDPSESPSQGMADDDPELEAELRNHEARLRQILRERLPRAAWPAYLQACEALADALAAGLSQADSPSSAGAGPRGIGFGAS
jgi:transcriptional regulator with XRE-family HTH domain